MTRDRNFRNVVTAFALMVALLSTSVGFASAQTVPVPQTNLNNLIVTGTTVNALGQSLNFSGNFDATRFIRLGDGLALVGRLTGTLTNTATNVVQQVNQLVTLPFQIGTATCEILDLEIGAINLDLLGLVVAIAPIDINITAEAGPGNLLGNLLCAIANLLNGGSPLGGLAALLNRILAILS